MRPNEESRRTIDKQPEDISWNKGKICSAFSKVSRSPRTALLATQKVIQRASLNQRTSPCFTTTLLTLSVIKGHSSGRCRLITAGFDSTCTCIHAPVHPSLFFRLPLRMLSNSKAFFLFHWKLQAAGNVQFRSSPELTIDLSLKPATARCVGAVV
jgi:hypothetical protein